MLTHSLGLTPYAEAWALQQQLQAALVARKVHNRSQPPGQPPLPVPHYLLLLEHPPVYTLGKSADPANLMWTEAQRQQHGILTYHIERGGDITYHGPGQLVAYPIWDLEQIFTDLARYLRGLEEAVIRTLAHYGLQGQRLPGYTGVWLEVESPRARKICAMGIKCSRWVTMHGLAFNINTDLAHFQGIVPCGIAQPDKAVTSLAAELGHPVPLTEVEQLLVGHLADVFGLQPEWQLGWPVVPTHPS